MDITKQNQTYMQNIRCEEVPWHRITTAYGRAADFPEYFTTVWKMTDSEAVSSALNEIMINIEHQSTLWHATPFAMIFLVRIFQHALAERKVNEIARFVVDQLLDFFTVIAECFQDGDGMEHADQLPFFSDMLDERYLWSEEYDEEEDEIRYEEEDVFPDDLFYSFWYYSCQALRPCAETLEELETSEFRAKAGKLKELLSEWDFFTK